jgi:hypothetical protein
MALGDEVTGDRPWTGVLRDLVILDRAVDAADAAVLAAGGVPVTLEEAVVARFSLDDGTDLRSAKVGFPSLMPAVRRVTRSIPGTGATLDASFWLVTEAPVPAMAQRVNATRQFTVAVTVIPGNLEQDGPARILTVSGDPFHRNLTVGQAGTALVLRWRSFLTGNNGTSPEVVFPAVFSSTASQRLVISCHGARIGFHRAGAGLGDDGSLRRNIGVTRQGGVTALKVPSTISAV